MTDTRRAHHPIPQLVYDEFMDPRKARAAYDRLRDENPAKIVALVPAPQQPPAESMTPEIIEKIRREGFEKANELIEILNREQEVREACNSAAKPGDKQ